MADHSYLIVAPSSYIGSYVAEHLLDKYPGSKVTVLDSRINTVCAAHLMSKFEKNPEKCPVIIGDPANDGLVKRIFAERKIDVVLYTVRDVTAEPWNPANCFRETMSSLTQFLEATRRYGKLKKFVFLSTAEVYGNQTAKLETTATKPCSLRGATIAACETMLNSYIISYRIPAVTVRLSTVIYDRTVDNPAMYFQQEGDVKKGKSQSVGLLHIQDAVAGICAALEKGKIGKVYNIGGLCDCPPDFAEAFTTAKKDEISNEKIVQLPPSMSSGLAERELLWKATIRKTAADQQMTKLCAEGGDQGAEENRGAAVHKILIHGTEEILKRCEKLIQDKKENVVIGKRLLDSNSDDDVTNEIIALAPSHIIYLSITTEDSIIDTRAFLKKNVYATLYAPWFLASFCKKCSIHFTYLSSYNPFDVDYFTQQCKDSPVNDDVASLEHCMAISLFTDRLLKNFDNVLLCRSGLIIDKDNISGKLEFLGLPFIPESAFHISFLPDCISIILDLALNGHSGAVDVANPGPVAGQEIKELCNSANIPCAPISRLVAGQGTDAKSLNTSLVERLYPNIRGGNDIIRELVAKATFNKGI